MDSVTVYFILYCGYTGNNTIELLYGLLLFTTEWDIFIKLRWIKGKDNILVNTLSYFKYNVIANIYLY
jgi:hypothetical protein